MNVKIKLSETSIYLLKYLNNHRNMEKFKRDGILVDYDAPEYVKGQIEACFIPNHRFNLSMKNTPIHPWNFYLSAKNQKNLFIKREDMNSSTLAGNKIKKLEFLAAEAIKNGHDHLISWGGYNSNHCRTVSNLAARLGMRCTLFQTSPKTNDNEKSIDGKELKLRGNLLLSNLAGAKINLVPPSLASNDYFATECEKLKQQELAKKSSNPFIVKIGASQKEGIFGFIQLFDDMIHQDEFYKNKITDVFVGSGTVGTALGLALANKFYSDHDQEEAGDTKRINWKIKIHAIRVDEPGDNSFAENRVKIMLKDINLPEKWAENNFLFESYDQYSLSYGVSDEKVDEIVKDSMRKTGVPLDCTYTGKVVRGMLDVMENHPEKLMGDNVLFLHTGGVFGLFNDRNVRRILE